MKRKIVKKYYKSDYNSPVGTLTLACDENENLVGLWIEGQKYFGDTIDSEMTEKNKLKIFDKTKHWLGRYFKGEKPEISELPLKPMGNEFRQEVWQILCEIPYGKYITYGDIAKEIAKKRGVERMSAQAVGGAVGHNPISIIIPCHRVVGVNGNLTGYSGGIKTKIKLLEHEGTNIEGLYIPHKSTAL